MNTQTARSIKVIVPLVLALVGTCLLGADAPAGDAASLRIQVKLLSAQNKMLIEKLASAQNRIAELEAEVATLKALLKKAGIDAPKPVAPTGDDAAATAAVIAMAKAMETGDGDAFAACFDATAEEKAVLKELGTAMGKLMAFQRAWAKAYGEAVWKEASGGRGGPIMPTAEELAKKIQIKVDGDKAVCTMEDKKSPLNLVKKDGKWLIKPDQLLPPQAGREQMVKMMKAMAGAVDDPMKKIGQPGTTAKQIHKEFNAAMMSAMMKMVPTDPPPKTP